MTTLRKAIVEASANICKEVTVETLYTFGMACKKYSESCSNVTRSSRTQMKQKLGKMIQEGFDLAEARLEEQKP